MHDDYRLDNRIFHPHEPCAPAVLDRELSTRRRSSPVRLRVRIDGHVSVASGPRRTML
ncbi:hypothetical protein [Burkholderia sp. JP2-270]|uniref:hypothetical protein n=1 Tax=Burkholderia sp. JP2-270 TaxID=2217913 RepID=UPI0013A6E49F|nr:hypothetical protein [Burkholderia sp. JP2-270]